MYKTTATKAWETAALWIIKKHKRTPLQNNVIVTMTFYFGDHRRRDIDGGIKYVLDILTKGIVYNDNSQVIDLRVWKRYDKDNPRCEVIALEDWMP